MTYALLTREQSKTLTLLKGFAILLVVMIHCDIRNKMGATLFSQLDLYMQGLTREIVTDAVPMFFFISGFLFFLKKDTYLNKWKKRAKSLVVPYIFTCLWGIFLMFIFQKVLGLESLFQGGKVKHLSEFAPLDYLRCFWDIRSGAPVVDPLWFLRNLIVLVLLTPAFSILIKYLKWGFPVLLTANYLFFHIGFLCLSASDYFYFGMGSYLALSPMGGVNILDHMRLKILVPVWVITFAATMVTYRYGFYHTFAHDIFMIVDCLLMYRLMRAAVDKWDMNWLVKISAASFFIYLFHEPWLGYFIGVSFKFLHPTGIVCYLMPWFFCAFAVGYSYVAYLILKRFTPKLLSVITGSR